MERQLRERVTDDGIFQRIGRIGADRAALRPATNKDYSSTSSASTCGRKPCRVRSSTRNPAFRLRARLAIPSSAPPAKPRRLLALHRPVSSPTVPAAASWTWTTTSRWAVRVRLVEPIPDPNVREVFAELSSKFVGFMDVLSHISERTATPQASGTDILRLYEKWLRTGSVRDGQRLVEHGLLPNQSIGHRFVQ